MLISTFFKIVKWDGMCGGWGGVGDWAGYGMGGKEVWTFALISKRLFLFFFLKEKTPPLFES